jgi:hypothetical protein
MSNTKHKYTYNEVRPEIYRNNLVDKTKPGPDFGVSRSIHAESFETGAHLERVSSELGLVARLNGARLVVWGETEGEVDAALSRLKRRLYADAAGPIKK